MLLFLNLFILGVKWRSETHGGNLACAKTPTLKQCWLGERYSRAKTGVTQGYRISPKLSASSQKAVPVTMLILPEVRE